jgi:predicted short-subunit dehydrogenase-like oxidoreductase (DUF2520 family)
VFSTPCRLSPKAGISISLILPFLLESSDVESSEILISLAESIGGKVHFVDTEQRRMLHLAAVFVCNFTNHMLTLGRNVALKADFPFDTAGSS